MKKFKDNPPYEISNRNTGLQRRTGEVSGDNRYTEETRKIIEKLGRLATSIADHFGWEPGLVMQDFVKDLALINDPSLIQNLDPNNPIDQMTQELMQMYIADEEAFNIFRNTALAQIMNMSEQRAIQTLEQLISRGQLGNRTNQYIGTRNARRIGHNDSEVNDSQSQEIAQTYKNFKETYGLDLEELVYGPEGFMQERYPEGFPDFYGDIIFSEKYWTEFEQWLKDTKGITIEREESENDFWKDSREDELRFTEKFGEKNLNRFKRLSQKLQGNYRDITWVIANIENTEDLNEILNNADFYGYEPDAENEDFAMFNVNDLQKCQKLANGTSWCIAVPTAWNTYQRFGATYKFYINKNNGDKYCVASVGGANEIVDKNDRELAKLPEGVPGEQLESAVVREDVSSAEALVGTALANIQLLPVETLRIAYDDLFSEELDMLEDEEVKAWLSQKIQEMDTNELKRYIENHIDDFSVVRPADEHEEEIEMDEDYERAWGPADDEEDEDDEDDEEVYDSLPEEKSFEEEITEYLAPYAEVEVETYEDGGNMNVLLTTDINVDDIEKYECIKDVETTVNYDEEGNIESFDAEPVLDDEKIFNYILDTYKLKDFNNKEYEMADITNYTKNINDVDFSELELIPNDEGEEFNHATVWDINGSFWISIIIPFTKK